MGLPLTVGRANPSMKSVAISLFLFIYFSIYVIELMIAARG